MQFNLLDLSGKETKNKVVIEWLDINSVCPSDDNPRLNLNQEVIDGLVAVLKESGWATISPIAVRKIDNGYEVVDGHHRLESAKQAGATQVLCTVLEITDEEAVIQRWLLNNQTEFKDIEKCLYFYKHTKKDSKLGLSRAEFAKKLNAHNSTGNRWAYAGEVINESCLEARLLEGKTRALAEIHSTPKIYWQQLTELLIKNEWSVKQTEEICKAVRDIDIPEYFQEWLNPDKYIKKTISEALTGSIRTPKDVNNWVTTADKHYQGLDSEAKVTLIVEDKEVIEYRDLKAIFLTKLLDTTKGDKAPSIKKIDELALQVRKEVDVLNQKHLQWVASQASEKAKKEIEQQKEKELLERKIKYSPSGYNDCLLNILPNLEVRFNAIITDPPYLLSNDGITVRSGKQTSVNKNFADSLGTAIHPEKYLQLFADCLIDGGYFVFTCTHHLRDIIRPIANNYGFEFIQDLIWYKPNATPLLTADRFKDEFEYISVYRKGNNSSYFGYEDIKEGESQKGSLITINQCGGNERLGWHDTQKPLALMELLIKAYCPENGFVLDPFAGTGTTAIACKKLNRICYWIEQEKDFFDKTQSRIDESKFSWE